MSRPEQPLWGPIRRADWDETEVIAGRVASREDVEAGRAVFHLEREGGVTAAPLELELPRCAIHVEEDSGEETPVIVIQGEAVDGSELIGYRFLDGGNGIGLRSEFVFLEGPDERFRFEGAGDGNG